MLIKEKNLSYFEAIATIVGAVVGAGVLGIPYVVAQVGFGVGMTYVLVLGLVVLSLNLLLGEIVSRTKGSLQLSGLARKYLGKPGEIVMGVTFFLSVYGALLAYIIGQGEVLQALFGGSSFVWSLAFFVLGALFLHRGLRTVKVAELIMTILLFVVVVVIAIWSAPSIAPLNLQAAPQWSMLFLPYGVILFAFHGSSAIAVAHAVLPKKQVQFKKAIIWAGILPIILYAVFTTAVVGVTGVGTTEIATVGLGRSLGPILALFGNVFAFFAMGTSFLLIGVALRETYEWDYRLRPNVSWALTLIVPLVFFLFGLRSFIQVLSATGAIFISTQAILIVLMYWKAHKNGDLPARRFRMQHAVLVSAVLICAFSLAAIYSIYKFFG